MKKSIALLLSMIFSLNILVAQVTNVLPTGVQITPEGIEVPAIVSNKFNIDYPNVNPIWQMDGDYYTAEFADETTDTKNLAVYDQDGNIIHKDEEIDHTHYPRTIEDYYNKNYPNENYIVWLSEDNKGNKTYYTIRKSTIIWFDKTGSYLSTKNKELSKK